MLKLYRVIVRIYLRIKFFGFRYYCPFCFGGFREFYSAGFSFPVLREKDVIAAGYREHVRCPMCNSSNRERLMFFFLRSRGFFNADKKIHILHIAPERGLQNFLKRLSHIQHTSIDLVSSFADKLMDINHIEFNDGVFDLVICNNVLEHIVDDVQAMREIHRVLKQGGNALFMVPIAAKLEKTFEDPTVVDEKERERIFGQSDHVRIYASDFEERVKFAGFYVQKIFPAGFLKDADIRHYAIDPREAIFWATK